MFMADPGQERASVRIAQALEIAGQQIIHSAPRGDRDVGQVGNCGKSESVAFPERAREVQGSLIRVEERNAIQHGRPITSVHTGGVPGLA